MKKIYQLTFVLFILSVFALSYPVTQVFAQGGGQCDSNPACNPNDSNGIPCCSSGSNNMSSGTLPPRIPAPSGHDKMNHENRKLSDKSDLPEGQELRDSFMGCQRELKNRIEQIQNLQDNAVQSSCGRGASQANVDAKKIRDLRSDLQTLCDNLVTMEGETTGFLNQPSINMGGWTSANSIYREIYPASISICEESGWSCTKDERGRCIYP